MNAHDELERELSAALRGRADRMADAPLSLQDVTGKARTIRRNRRLATGAGLLAAAAVIVPMAILAGGDVQRGHEEPMPVTEVPKPVTQVVQLSPDAPMGEAPRIPWIEGRTIHLPDGTSIRAPRPYLGVFTVGGEVLALWNDDETGAKELDQLDSSGAVVGSTPITGDSVATNTDGSVIAYQIPGAVQLRTSEGARTIYADLGQVQLVAVDGDDTCAEGCSVYFSRNGEQGGAARVDLDGTVTEVAPGALSIEDVHADRVAALTFVEQVESCSAVFAAGAEEWETCDYTLGAFSPDGEWLVGSDEYLDGLGQSMAVILDAGTGERQVEYDAGEGFVSTRIWEDDTHALLAHYTYGEGLWRLYRVGLDGSVEQAAEPIRAPDFNGSPFRLSE